MKTLLYILRHMITIPLIIILGCGVISYAQHKEPVSKQQLQDVVISFAVEQALQ